MKKIFIIAVLSCFLGVNTLNAAETNIPVKSSIQSATVFISGAQVFRTGSVKVPAGLSTLVFEKLSHGLNPQSIQVSGKGDFTILSVTHRHNFLEDREKSNLIAELEKMLKSLELEKTSLSGMKAVYDSEESMLLANKIVGGSQNGLDPARLREMSDFFRTRMTEISAKRIEILEKIRLLDIDIQKLRNQLNQAGNQSGKPVSEILVQISSGVAGTIDLEVSYLVAQAGWSPAYDLRANDVSHPIEIIYKAGVYQNTGENWEKISLSLSTGNPRLSGTLPELTPWYLNFFEPVYRALEGRAAGVRAKSMILDEEMEAADMTVAASTAAYTQVNEGQTQVRFDIRLPFSVESDGQLKTVEIARYNLPATFAYHSVPKLDQGAFLKASLTSWEDLNLLPGEMNLFFEGTYVGKSFLETRNTGDTLNLSLGRDEKIIVDRIRLKDFTRKQLLGNKVTESRSWEIRLRNNKSEAVRIRIQDQVPVSSNKEIEISVIEKSEAGFNSQTGILTWEINLAPGESKTLKTGYEVKYPAGRKLILE